MLRAEGTVYKVYDQRDTWRDYLSQKQNTLVKRMEVIKNKWKKLNQRYNLERQIEEKSSYYYVFMLWQ